MEGQTACSVYLDNLLEPFDLSRISASPKDLLMAESTPLIDSIPCGELFDFLIAEDCISPISTEDGLSPAQSDENLPCEVKCAKCLKVCKSQRGLNQHIGKVHSKKKRHSICDICGSSFRNKYVLRFHVKQVHEQTTRIVCPICDTVLYNKYMLPKHMQREHSYI